MNFKFVCKQILKKRPNKYISFILFFFACRTLYFTESCFSENLSFHNLNLDISIASHNSAKHQFSAEILIPLKDGQKATHFNLNSPNRLIIDIENLKTKRNKEYELNTSWAWKVRSGVHAKMTRVVFDLKGDQMPEYHVFQDSKKFRIKIVNPNYYKFKLAQKKATEDQNKIAISLNIPVNEPAKIGLQKLGTQVHSDMQIAKEDLITGMPQPSLQNEINFGQIQKESKGLLYTVTFEKLVSYIEPSIKQTDDVIVTNTNSVKTGYSAIVLKTVESEGQRHSESTNEVHISPKTFLLEPSQKRTLRIFARNKRVEQEEEYKVVILPFSEVDYKSMSNAELFDHSKNKFAQSIKIFVYPHGAESRLSWVIEDNILRLKNEGNLSAILDNGKKCRADDVCEKIEFLTIKPEADISLQITGFDKISFIKKTLNQNELLVIETKE